MSVIFGVLSLARDENPFMNIIREAKGQSNLLNPDATFNGINIIEKEFGEDDWTIAFYNGRKSTTFAVVLAGGAAIVEITATELLKCYRNGNSQSVFLPDVCDQKLRMPLRAALAAITNGWQRANIVPLRLLFHTQLIPLTKAQQEQGRSGVRCSLAVAVVEDEAVNFLDNGKKNIVPTILSEDRMHSALIQRPRGPAAYKDGESNLHSANVIAIQWKWTETATGYTLWDGKAKSIKDELLYKHDDGGWYPFGVFPVQLQGHSQSIQHEDPHVTTGDIQYEGNCGPVYHTAGCPGGGQCHFNPIYEEWQQNHPSDDPDPMAITVNGVAYNNPGEEYLGSMDCMPGCQDYDPVDWRVWTILQDSLKDDSSKWEQELSLLGGFVEGSQAHL
ncbi:uncharacterized protein N7459_005039 [Penicillium hispanicum]|uniref:uncharacterized protein n=1 Tax=Penicillium hispanicum TaxID=1080232 RepID=UPI00253FCAF2|nr:uncharacterized protein N7459_005039 [Penicillium hispanicum]KAJ5585239.1 hypothetical protein N7459_005039 [Penicillium hispanicum]